MYIVFIFSPIVSPFYFSDTDIKPSRYVPLWWAFLPPKSGATVDWLYSLGFHDCLNYFEKRGLSNLQKRNNKMKIIAKNPHPYDVRRTVSIHRFLGI